MTDLPPAEVLVCIKCRRGTEVAEDERRPGAALLDALTTQNLPHGVTVTPVECLQNCDAGCTVALRGTGRWTYVYGNLHEVSHLDTLVDGITRYHVTEDGIIPWRERPDHFKKNCVARLPPLPRTGA